MTKYEEARNQFKNEIKSVFVRYCGNESDLCPQELIDAGVEAIEEWAEGDLIEFESE